MFLAGVRVLLVFEGAEGSNDAGTGLGGLDDRVDVAALCGHEGIGKAVAELGDFFLAQFLAVRFGNFVEIALVDDVHGALRTHDRDFRGGPGEIGIRSNVFRSHDAVCATVGLTRDDGDFRNGGFGERKEQLRAMLDDAAEFLLRAREKTGNVFEGDERNVESVAETDEARTLHGSADIQNPGEKRRLIGDDANGTAVEACKSNDQVLRVMFVDFEE